MITERIYQAIILVLVVGFSISKYTDHQKLIYIKGELATANADIGTLNREASGYQNTITGYQQQAKDREQAAKVALAEAEAAAAKKQATIDWLRARKPVTVDTCQDTDAMINETLQREAQ